MNSFTTRWICKECNEQSMATPSSTLAEADCWAGVHDQLMHGILPQLRTYANAYAKPMFVWEK